MPSSNLPTMSYAASSRQLYANLIAIEFRPVTHFAIGIACGSFCHTVLTINDSYSQSEIKSDGTMLEMGKGNLQFKYYFWAYGSKCRLII